MYRQQLQFWQPRREINDKNSISYNFCNIVVSIFRPLYFAKGKFRRLVYCFILYVIGLFWVMPFILRKNMTMPYGSSELTLEPKYKWQRLFLFFIGLLISLAATLSSQN